MNDVGSTMDDIRTTPQLVCPLCGAEGPVIHAGLHDRFYDVPGSWSLRRCVGGECQAVWLDPRPATDELPKLYRTYYTHDADRGPAAWVLGHLSRFVLARQRPDRSVAGRLAGAALGWVGPLREHAEGELLWLPAASKGRLLDVGCGGGEFLWTARSYGWEVVGVEPDPAGGRVARERGLEVYVGELEAVDLPPASFDVVTLSHVVEHLPDPISTLRHCHRLLRPGGRLYLVTPNADSLGARQFGPHWMPWEVPRHLVVFTPAAMRRVVLQAGLSVCRLTTPARTAWSIWRLSNRLRTHPKIHGCRFPPELGRLPHALTYHLSEYRRSRRELVGEELFLEAERTNPA